MGTTPIKELRRVLAGGSVRYKLPARAQARGPGSANWPVVHATIGYVRGDGCRTWLLDYYSRQAAGAPDPLGIDSREVGGYHAAYASALMVALLTAERLGDGEMIDVLFAALRRRLALSALLSVPHRGTSVVLMPACRAAGYLTRGGQVLPPVAADRDWMMQMDVGLLRRSYAPLTWRYASRRAMDPRLGVALFAERFDAKRRLTAKRRLLPWFARSWVQGARGDGAMRGAVDAASELGVSTLWPIRLRRWGDDTYCAHFVGRFACLDDPRPVVMAHGGQIAAVRPPSTHRQGRWWPRGRCEVVERDGWLDVLLTGSDSVRGQGAEWRHRIELPGGQPEADITIDLKGVRETGAVTTPPSPTPPSPAPQADPLQALRQALGRELERRLDAGWTLERVAAWVPVRFRAIHDQPQRTTAERALIVRLTQDAERVLGEWTDREAVRSWIRSHFDTTKMSDDTLEKGGVR